MPTITRTRRIEAGAAAVWRVVGDPNHMPRWWPRVRRVEDVGDESFTTVLATSKGKPVRAAFRVLDRDRGRRVAWTQELEGGPFERLLRESRTEIALTPAADGTEVAITLSRRLRGMSRLGGVMFRNAARDELDEALESLARIVR